MMSKLNKGDKVRFISTKGGGVVSRIEPKGVVYVAIEDGFEIPCQANDLVVIQSDESASRIFNKKNEFEKVDLSKQAAAKVASVQKPQTDKQISNLPKPSKGLYCAFIPKNQNLILGGDSEMLLVNYTTAEVFVRFMLLNPNSGLKTVKTAVLTSGEAYHLTVFSFDDRLKWFNGKVQCLFVDKKKEKIYSSFSTNYSIKDQKFFKEDNFKENVFFDEKAFIVQLVDFADIKEETNDVFNAENIVEKIEKNSGINADKKRKYFIDKYIVEDDLAEIDLHIEKIRSDYKKLPEEEIIITQISWFKQCLESAIERGLHRVVFIHGVGVGILKMEIRKIMQNYPDLKYQDANILKYGVGATEVFLK